MEMTAKERLLASIKGEKTDRPAWSPFLAYWWENNPKYTSNINQLDFIEQCGADPLLRGFGNVCKTKFVGTEQKEEMIDGIAVTSYITPVGTLTLRSKYSPAGNTWFLFDHPVKTAEDLKILTWMYEHATVEPNENAEKDYYATGERGLMVPTVGFDCKTCFQSLVERWIGTVNLAYIDADEPEAIEECLDAMRKASMKTVEIAVNTPYEAFIFWEDSSTTNISPSMFEKYTAPEIKAWGDLLHKNGKMLIHHACGLIRHLLPLMGKLPIDAIESISPPPTGDIDIADAFKLLPENIGLIGGIEPVFFENCNENELEKRIYELLEIGKNKRFLLANSDSCPPKVAYEKFLQVSNIVKK